MQRPCSTSWHKLSTGRCRNSARMSAPDRSVIPVAPELAPRGPKRWVASRLTRYGTTVALSQAGFLASRSCSPRQRSLPWRGTNSSNPSPSSGESSANRIASAFRRERPARRSTRWTGRSLCSRRLRGRELSRADVHTDAGEKLHPGELVRRVLAGGCQISVGLPARARRVSGWLPHRLGSEFGEYAPQSADASRERIAVPLDDGVKLLGQRGGFVIG